MIDSGRTLVVGAGLATLCLSSTTPAAALDSRIIFDSERRGTSRIYVIGQDGSNLRPVTDSADSSIFSRLPDWSPDCSQVVFVSNRDSPNNHDLYLTNANGTDVRRLTTHPAIDTSPAWSPAGRRIAFDSERNGTETIFILTLDDMKISRLVEGPAFYASWSPDGRKVVFISGSPANWDIFVASVHDGVVEQLSNTPDVQEHGPVWSPNGDKILFDALRNGRWEIYSMDTDGSDVRQLTENSAIDARPSWSPDGLNIVFHSTRDFGSDGATKNWHEFEIYVMNFDGAMPRRLTHNNVFDAHPDWCTSP